MLTAIKLFFLDKALPVLLGMAFAASVLLIAVMAGQNANLRVKLALERAAMSDLKAKVAQERLDASELIAQTRSNYLTAERALRDAADKDKEKADAQIAALTGRAAALVASLRSAQAERDAAVAAVSRTTPDSPAAEAPPERDGAGLPATIGEADVAEAARAETIRVALLQCYAANDRAYEALLFFNQPGTHNGQLD
jgi:hypothetical protein